MLQVVDDFKVPDRIVVANLRRLLYGAACTPALANNTLTGDTAQDLIDNTPGTGNPARKRGRPVGAKDLVERQKRGGRSEAHKQNAAGAVQRRKQEASARTQMVNSMKR